MMPCGTPEQQKEGARVEIADVGAALDKVRNFIALIDQNEPLWRAARTAARSSYAVAQLKQSDSQIHELLPLILRIADRVDPEVAAKLRQESHGWHWRPAMEASRQLVGLLSSIEETERILGPVGPRLAAASLHSWIWNAAVDLWDNGHRREAVQAAAQALFDSHLPTKLALPRGRSAKDLVAQAFSTDPPTAGSSRLRFLDYPDPSPDWTSEHEGARFFGMGCAQLIRNLVTHGAQPDEQTALEQLAALSLLARLIDQAKLATV